MRRLCLGIALLAPVLLAVARLRRFQRWAVSGASMSPALQPGDWLLVERLGPGSRQPSPGEIVLVPDPREPSRVLIKRLVRLETGGLAWLEGDNPPHSTDSRHFGPVPVASVKGVVRYRYWPPRRAGKPV